MTCIRALLCTGSSCEYSSTEPGDSTRGPLLGGAEQWFLTHLPTEIQCLEAPFLLLPFTHLRCAKVSTTSQMTSPPTVQTHPVTAEQAGTACHGGAPSAHCDHRPDVEDDSDGSTSDVPAVQQENIPPPSSWSRCALASCIRRSLFHQDHTCPCHAISEMDFFHCLLTQHTLQTIAPTPPPTPITRVQHRHG